MSKAVVTSGKTQRQFASEPETIVPFQRESLGIRIFMLTLVIAATSLVVSCSSDSPDYDEADQTPFPPLDPASATLEQILERTRIAMGEITSYQTRGTMVITGRTPDDGGSGDYFTAWQAPDRFMFRTEGVDPDSGENQFMEFRTIGIRSFADTGDDW